MAIGGADLTMSGRLFQTTTEKARSPLGLQRQWGTVNSN